MNGLGATSKTGVYFRNNVWWWRPLANYVMEVCNITNEDGWHTNSGHKITALDAADIYNKLHTELKKGNTKKYAAAYTKRLEGLPNEPCHVCKGDKTYIDTPCHVCNETGEVDHWEKNYPFSVDNVKMFIAFVKESGGFEIY